METAWEGWTIDTANHEVRSPDGAVVCKGLDWSGATWIGPDAWPLDFTLNASMSRVYNLPDGHFMGVWWSGERWEFVTYGDTTMSRLYDSETKTIKFVPNPAGGASPTINLVGHPSIKAFAKAMAAANIRQTILPLLDKACSYLFVVSGPGLRTLPLTAKDAWGDEGNLSTGIYHVLTRNRDTGVEDEKIVVGLKQPNIRYLNTADELKDAATTPIFAAVGLMAMETKASAASGSIRRIMLHCPFWASMITITNNPDVESLHERPHVVKAVLDVVLNGEEPYYQSKPDLASVVQPLFDAVKERLERVLDERFAGIDKKAREDAEGDYLEKSPIMDIVDDVLRVWDADK